MKLFSLLILFCSFCIKALSQGIPATVKDRSYNIGYKNIIAVDSSRIYKPASGDHDRLHYRPLEIDYWYPVRNSVAGLPLPYGYFLDLLQKRSNRFQDDTVYHEMTSELISYLSANLNIRDTGRLMRLSTLGYLNAPPDQQKKFPLIIYLCSFNGMSYENLSLFEALAAQGYLVACITSVGSYPGNMSTQIPDILEQVADADFAIHYLKMNQPVDGGKIGVIGYSWGGLAAMALSLNNKDVKSFLSLDGSELHYYGNSKEEDIEFDQIIHSPIFRGKKLDIPFAYLESGFKQSDAIPDSIYNVFDLTMNQKLYRRFTKAVHEDFSFLTSLPKSLNEKTSADKHPSIPYKEFAIHFFDDNLKDGKNTLLSFLDSLNRIGITDFRIPELKRIKKFMPVKGIVEDEKSLETLAYVNIGIRNKNTGTVSAQHGIFELNIDSTLKGDTLTFSMTGYETRNLPVADFSGSRGPVTVFLKEKITELKEVNITSKALKSQILGNTTTSRFISIGLPLKFLGSETGIRLHLGSKPVLIKRFGFNISDNRLDSAIFRLNIYRMRNEVPFENILHQNIFVPVGKQSGQYTLDLTEYKLVFNGDILLSLEWIEGSASTQRNGAIFLSAGFLNSATWHRLTSQAEWKKATGLGVGINVLVQKLK